MHVMVEFSGGGPVDGKTLAAGEDPEFNADKALWVLRLAGATLDIAARKEVPAGTLLIWRVPSVEMAQQANAEGWSEAKVKALMQYHEYHVTSFEETDGLVLFKARYRGVT